MGPVDFPRPSRRKQGVSALDATSRRHTYPEPSAPAPTLSASGEVASLQDRLRNVGETPQEPQTFDTSPFGQLLTHLARPGAAVRGAITSGKDLLSGAQQGWNDPNSVPTGSDIYTAMGQTNLPFAGVNR